jgi:hypothetical protein
MTDHAEDPRAELVAAAEDVTTGRQRLLDACTAFHSAIDRVDFNAVVNSDFQYAMGWLHDIHDAAEGVHDNTDHLVELVQTLTPRGPPGAATVTE